MLPFILSADIGMTTGTSYKLFTLAAASWPAYMEQSMSTSFINMAGNIRTV